MSQDPNIIITAVFSITAVVLGMFLFFVLMMVRNHRRIEAAQREKIRQMQLFSDKLQSVREDEQKHISRELHDELGGTLTSLKYDLLWMEQQTSTQGEVPQRCKAMRDIIDATTKTVQRISSELRPKILDTLGLAAAIEWQASEFQKRTGIKTQVQLASELPLIDESRDTGIYRIVQESLTNVARHSQATQVDILLHFRDNNLHVEIVDNGKGFDHALMDHPESLGLLSIQERARMIGGSAKILGSVGKGTQVVAEVPIQNEHQLPTEKGSR
jgi:signal transduction histidine kinase